MILVPSVFVLYVSGPMSGYDDYNFPAFNHAAHELRHAGYIVINPAENWGGAQQVPRELCMRLDLFQVSLSNGIALLEGWEESPGAKLEVQTSKEMGGRIMTVENWLYEKGIAA